MMRSFVLAFMALGSAVAFTSSPMKTVRPTTSLQMKNDGKKVAASFVAAAYLVANIFAVDAAIAAVPDDNMDFGSTEILAGRGRSGGRGGGRAARAPSRPAARSAPAPTRTIERTTVIQSPSVVAAPPVVVAPVSPFGYSPLGGGFGVGLGVGGMINDIGNEIRDNRQEMEIQRSRAELEQAKQREADMEARLRQLEAAQAR